MKIKILQFSIAASEGGRTQYIMNLWKHIDHSKFVFDFVTFSNHIDFEDELSHDGCNVFYLQNYPENDRKGFISEFRDILKSRYDVIEIHTSYWKDTIVEELSREAGIRKIIIHGHSTGITQITANIKYEEEQRILNHYNVKERLNEKMATDYWACSEECSEWLFRPQIPNNRIKLIPNTVDTNKFRYDINKRNETRNKLGINDEFVIGFVGRLEPVKNLRFLVDVFLGIIQVHQKSKLLIVGDGSEKSDLQEYVKRNEIEKNVIFAGKSRGVEKFYNAMDLFVLPSFFEGFPLVVLEAFCSGLKCAISKNITESICISDDIKRLSIKESKLWIDFALATMKKIDREDCCNLLIEKGLDTSTQIKRIEEMYRS